MMKRVAIVGAGPSGILAVKALKPLHEAGKVDVVAYEKQARFGGLWNGLFMNEVGTDRWGENCHSGQYKNLWINSPRFCIELPEFPQPDDWPAYVPGPKMTEWWNQYVSKFDLEKFIRLNTNVQMVKFNEATGKFAVTVRPFGKEAVTEKFDYVIVATGHFSHPHEPDFPGLTSFPGELFHSHNYRDGSKYKGKRVLCIGGAYSAEDIALQLWKYGAAHVTITCKRPTYAGPDTWPRGIEEKPILTQVAGSTVSFSDGTSGDYDVIIRCTGYEHRFPFMADNIKLITKNTFAIPLYSQTVFPDNPKVFYVGMPDQAFAYPMFKVQGEYIAKIITGDIELPPKTEMMKYIREEQELEQKATNLDDQVDFQARHVNALTLATGGPNLDVSRLFHEWLANKRKGILTFRDAVHTSHYTGKTAPPLPELWLESLSRQCSSK